MNKSIYILIVILCSCSAAKHLQISEKHRLIAISKGAKVSVDTVYKEVIKFKEVPAAAASTPVAPVIDTEAFDNTMFGNDSLVLLIDSLQDQLKKKEVPVDTEKTMYALKQANRRINELKKRLSHGFSKDSTYTFNPDSVMTVWVTLKNGLVSNVGYNRKRTELTWMDKIPIYIDQKVKAGFTIVELIGGIIFGVVLGALILGIVLWVRGRDEDHV